MSLPERLLDRALSALLPLLLAGLVGLTLAQVALRYLAGQSLAWAEEAGIVLMICLAWGGVALLWLRDAHIAIDWLPSQLGPRGRGVLLGAIDLLALAGAATLAVLAQGAIDIFWDIDLLALGMPAAVKYLPVQIGAGLLAVAAALRFLRRLRG